MHKRISDVCGHFVNIILSYHINILIMSDFKQASFQDKAFIVTSQLRTSLYHMTIPCLGCSFVGVLVCLFVNRIKTKKLHIRFVLLWGKKFLNGALYKASLMHLQT